MTAIRNAFVAAMNAGKNEDDIKMEMVKAGATFKNVAKTFNELMVSEGHVLSKEAKEAKVVAAVEGKDLATEEGFTAASDAIKASISGLDDRAAGCMVRWYARKKGLVFYTKPKAEANGSRKGFVRGFYASLLANPLMTEAEAQSRIDGVEGFPETSEGTKKAAARFQRVRALVNAVASGYEEIEDSSDESDDE